MAIVWFVHGHSSRRSTVGNFCPLTHSTGKPATLIVFAANLHICCAICYLYGFRNVLDWVYMANHPPCVNISRCHLTVDLSTGPAARDAPPSGKGLSNQCPNIRAGSNVPCYNIGILQRNIFDIAGVLI